MRTRTHTQLRPDQLHFECTVKVKGEPNCKHFVSKLLRNGITEFRRETSSKGRPYFEFVITVSSRYKYGRLMNIIDSTDEVEMAS
ncbi:MAG: hypothetical protein KDA78_14800 [Planctomycetaceae bacterium]|nr:hypothetical protein [Planctomycetaceae bacterium]